MVFIRPVALEVRNGLLPYLLFALNETFRRADTQNKFSL